MAAVFMTCVAIAACSSSTAATKPIPLPTTGPGGCGSKTPVSIPPPGDFHGIDAVAKNGVSGGKVLRSVPSDSVALWCSPVSFVNSHVHPPSLSVMFLPNASSADVAAARNYFARTGLFQSITIEPRYPYASFADAKS